MHEVRGRIKAQVTFLEDEIFQAATINLKKRIFKKGKPEKSARFLGVG